MSKNNESDSEIEAMKIVFNTVKDLDPASQNRVIGYVVGRLKLRPEPRATGIPEPSSEAPERKMPDAPAETVQEAEPNEMKDSDGISEVALKWMRRNQL